MAIELKVPEVGESITEGVVAEWLRSEGDAVAADEAVVIIETDKVNVEVPAPAAGVLDKILKRAGEEVEVGEVIGTLREGAAGERAPGTEEREPPRKRADDGAKAGDDRGLAAAEASAEKPAESGASEEKSSGSTPARRQARADAPVMPAARRLLGEAGIDPAEVPGTGKGGRVTKGDALRFLRQLEAPAEDAAADRRPAEAARAAVQEGRAAPAGGSRDEEAVRMTPLRRRVAERLVAAQQQAALLTTFNEVDMSRVIELRRAYRDAFEERHGIKLGFMSFFVKAAIEALKEIPAVNAEIRGEEIVYRNYYDIGVAVGGGRGLVVPVIRNAERLSFAEVEKAIADFAERARANKLELRELQGGTFTLSNGGVYGSLLSTPIVNPPQSGILGMHKIEDRPVAVEGEVVVRPMMYLALTYDHRLVDGREAVTFLVRLKERIEDPSRILLEV